MTGIFDDLLGGSPQPPLDVNPKAFKLLKLAANNTSPEEARAALDKAIKILEEPEHFGRKRIAQEHVGGDKHQWGEDPEGFDLTIEVNSTGQFEVTVDGGQRIAYGKTLEEAVANAKSALSKARAKIRVPFVTEDGQRAVAIGISLSDGKIMARDAENKPFRVDKWTGETFRGDMSDTDLARYQAAKRQADEADAILSELRQRYRHSLRAEVDKAYREVMGR